MIYVHRGDGTTTGQNAGITLNKTGQQLIGSGTNFVYDNGKFSTANGGTPSSILIAPATAAPVITIAGLTVDGASDDGIAINGADSITIHNISVLNSAGNGIQADYSLGANSNLTIDTITVDNATPDGIRIRTFSNAILNVSIKDSKIKNNGASGIFIQSHIDSKITGTFTGNTATGNNGTAGFFAQIRHDSTMSNILTNNVFTGNNSHGILIQGKDDSVTASTITGGSVTGNTASGILIQGLNNSQFNNTILQNIIVTGNTSNGVIIDDETSGAFNVDLGGGTLGSLGNNSIYGNVGADLRVDLDGGEFKAQNNWWGDATGLAPARVTLDAGSTVDSSNFLTVAP